MQIPDRTGVLVGYRVWRVIPNKWVSPSESLHAQQWLRSWSLTGATVAYCPPRLQGDPNKPLIRSSPCQSAPSFDCTCGLYAHYEPTQEAHRLPYVGGSMLAWGRVIHHADSSFFRAEKALPIAFVRPCRGGGVFPHLAKEKLFHIAEVLGAKMVEDLEELRAYSEMEASKW
ncbi:MAG TPA: hypothetical protein VHF46_00130 [Rubrobacteraceae bacterium]|nr:hypothetical protein [Rubrobacteraceae bacterium]